ncbi:MAG: molybdopterin-guanine dinucleotide biosynthesis protein MobB [Clostridia bacterium]|nr:molybdopterin-guanine dinucleotide biosynthesis protein MobB [Clostridia bacterium]
MKIVTIVGVRGAGKTTLVESLLNELQSRGLRAATVKTVFCPTFHMDKPGSNTDRHTRAGSELVGIRAEQETVLLYPRKLSSSEILAHYTDFDVVICEGDYDLPVPRIVAAHGEADALERVNGRTLAVSGVIANDRRELNGLPVLHPDRDAAALADLVLSTPDAGELSALDAPLNGPDAALSRDFCAHGCKGHAKKPAGVRAVVDGRPLTLTPEQENLIRSWL